ncbi:hypothetical protein ABH940_006014 [Streptacidiphilus sp. BW17]
MQRSGAEAEREKVEVSGMSGPPGVDVMVCEGCGEVTPWTPYGRCSWECYNLPRATPEEQQAALEAAPRAQAYFQALQAAAEARARNERPDQP